MDYQNAEFYKLNKNNPDLVYNFADELITYRKETDENGNLQIVEYRKKDGRKGKKTTRRVVPSHDMSIEDFDAWKKQLTDDAHEYFNKDKRETRENVSIENLLETDLVCEESVEEEYLRAEEERQALPKTMKEALGILDVLTPKQRSRYIQSKVYGKSVRDIAAEEGSDWTSVWESINAAEKRIEKELKKRGYNA
jgi:DNA-directed RNA polymerase specialized sigma24 family protein